MDGGGGGGGGGEGGYEVDAVVSDALQDDEALPLLS